MFYSLSHYANQKRKCVLQGEITWVCEELLARTSWRPLMGAGYKSGSPMEIIPIDMEGERRHGWREFTYF